MSVFQVDDEPEGRFVTFAHWTRRPWDPPVEWLGIVKQPLDGWEIVVQTAYEEMVTEFEEVCQETGYEYRIVCLL